MSNTLFYFFLGAFFSSFFLPLERITSVAREE